jgi:hypothetical protein
MSCISADISHDTALLKQQQQAGGAKRNSGVKTQFGDWKQVEGLRERLLYFT